jgi:hypothetical protein
MSQAKEIDVPPGRSRKPMTSALYSEGLHVLDEAPAGSLVATIVFGGSVEVESLLVSDTAPTVSSTETVGF